MQLFHDSRNPWYRFPGGALPCGAKTRLRLLLRAEVPPDAVTLRVWRDGEERIPMTSIPVDSADWNGSGGFDGTIGWDAEDGARLYQAELPAGETPGLVWYRFEVDAGGIRHLYGNAEDNLGGVGRRGRDDSYQVTVYDPAFDPPRWLREGVMYQIMVDRFFNGDPTGALFHARDDVLRHGDWYQPPALALTDQGDNLANDFYGGNLPGIRAKLPYLASLGVTVLYLNPIFEARSNHKYDVGDYQRVDPMFGDNAAFSALCADAAELGIRVMLDGVFSHVGEDSRYFNRLGRYPEQGAYQSKESPYYRWFTFHRHPGEYECWWGFRTLPNVREEEPSYIEYMLTGPEAVVPGWIRRGASAWRLDVADELPMPFLRELRKSVKAAAPEGAVLGEVWEDASNKVSYGRLRSYALGDTLDSAMNYPLREALTGFLLGRRDAGQVKRRLDALQENYPKGFYYSLMNLLGSHDRARILSVLAACDCESLPRERRRGLTLSPEQRAIGRRRVRLMLRLIAALPGMPCVYYGDEAGMEGAADPFCRAAYPWGREDGEQVAFFRAELIRRRAMPVLTRGECALLAPGEDVLIVIRRIEGGVDAFGQPCADAGATAALCAVNRADAPREARVPMEAVGGAAMLDERGQPARVEDGRIVIALGAMESVFLRNDHSRA